MTLQYLHKVRLGAILVDAWQKHLGTCQDPASGRWFADDPAGHGGLYGMLADELAPALSFEPSARTIGVHKLAVATGVVDNRDGQTPSAVLRLAHDYQDSVTTSHLVSKTLRPAIADLIQGKLGPEVFGNDFNTGFTADFTHSWVEATAVAKSGTQSFGLAVPVRKVPTGRAYQVMLVANRRVLSVPYRADITLSGTTTANFLTPVNGARVWRATAGDLCEWINRHDSAGDDSWFFSRDPADYTRGRLSLHGMLRAVRTENFTLRMLDVTENFSPAWAGPEPVPMSNTVSGGRVVDEVLVDEPIAA